MATAKRNVHVTHNKSTGMWQVKSEGASRAAATATTKQAAMAKGRSIAINRGSELIGHNRTNGQINVRSTYGPDPRSSRG